MRSRRRSCILACRSLPEQRGGETATALRGHQRGTSVTTWTSHSHSRHTSIIEKFRLPAAFGAFPIGSSPSFPLCLLLEPAVNEGTH